MPDLVTIASGLDLQTAYLARARLEGSGIYCFLANESLMHVHYPLFSFGVGGVDLRVLKSDVPEALEVLAGRELDETRESDAFPALEQCCPECKSTEFTRNRSGWLRGVLLTLFAIPLRLPRDRKTCKACGHRW
ncbi:MAG: DUF2007 domain-containing protein [Desulfovibrionaceae bacterium]|nr:DUF2007 domain-containing protein [Desulfovibrionaceae bacterium]